MALPIVQLLERRAEIELGETVSVEFRNNLLSTLVPPGMYMIRICWDSEEKYQHALEKQHRKKPHQRGSGEGLHLVPWTRHFLTMPATIVDNTRNNVTVGDITDPSLFGGNVKIMRWSLDEQPMAGLEHWHRLCVYLENV